jgi:trans-aconitate methyltransferase
MQDPLVTLLNPQPGERILDSGCGQGDLTALLGATGIDSSAVILEQARLAHPETTFLQTDLFTYSPAAPFDAVVSRGALQWMQPLPAACARIHALLRPGGRFAAEAGAPVKPLQLKECRAALVAAGFEILLLEQMDAWRVRLLARKPA